MKTCKNCSNEFEGNYCNVCGLKYIEKHTSKTFFSGLLEAFDINNRFFCTLKGIFITPRKLVSEYSNGNSKKYIGPFTMVFIVIGFYYAVSEFQILGFSMKPSVNEFIYIISLILSPIIAGVIAGKLNFTAFNWIKFVTIAMYLLIGMMILLFAGQAAESFRWIYETSKIGWLIFMVSLFAYIVFFMFSVFKGKYWSLCIFVGLFISIVFFQGKFDDFLFGDSSNSKFRPSKFLKSKPLWSIDKLDALENQTFTKNILTDSSFFETDVDTDGIRDISAFLSDSSNEAYLVMLNIKEDKGHVTNLTNLLGKSTDLEVIDVCTFEDPKRTFRLLYSDSSEYVIYWEENQFYENRAFRKIPDTPLGPHH